MRSKLYTRLSTGVVAVIFTCCCVLSSTSQGAQPAPGRPATRDVGLTIEKQDESYTYTIGKGGIVYVNREGLVAIDRDGTVWKSRKVGSALDSKIAFFPVAGSTPQPIDKEASADETLGIVSAEARHKWETKWTSESAATGITVKDTKVFDDGRRSQSFSGNIPIVRSQMVVDAPGSRDVKVEVDPAVKETWYAGLFFREPCVLEIREDFTLLVDKEGIRARDKDDNHWLSQKLALDGMQVIGFLPETAGIANRKKEEKSLALLLPTYTQRLKGAREIRVRNPNAFVVHTGVRQDKAGVNLEVPANGTRSVYVPDGKYEIYFVYSSKPDALFQGDNFTLDGHGVEIQIVKVVGGNYGIRQVK